MVRAKNLDEFDNKKCYDELVSAYAKTGATFQACVPHPKTPKAGQAPQEPLVQYGMSLVETSLESRLEEFNKQNPGFPRMVKIVDTEVSGKK